MDLALIPVLTDGLREYFPSEEIAEFCNAFDVKLEYDISTGRPLYARLAVELIKNVDHGNNRRLLLALVPSLVNRASDGVAHNEWDRRDYHQGQLSNLITLQKALGESAGLPEEISVAEDRPFSAKSEVREFLAKAETSITIVDAYVGAGTLDCLREVTQPIRLLTGQRSQSIEAGFDRALKDFIAEGRQIEVKQHPKLHDRYISFNERCWLLGSSLKDAGKKSFNAIESVDSRDAITQEIETKWNSAQPYVP